MLLSVDIESDGFLEEMTRIWCICAKDYMTGEEYKFNPEQLDDALYLLKDAETCVYHNGIGFDEEAIKKLYPKFKHQSTLDTLIMSRLIWTDIQDRDGINNHKVPDKLKSSHSLEAWGYRVDLNKGDFGKVEGFDTYKPEMLEYCMDDVRITDRLLHLIAQQNYSPEAIRLEHDFARVIQKQINSGFVFDTGKALELKSELETKRHELTTELDKYVEPTITLSKKPAMYHFDLGDYKLSHESKGKLRHIVKAQVGKEMTHAQINDSIIDGEPKVTVTPFNPNSGKQKIDLLKSKTPWIPEDFTEAGTPKTDAESLSKLDHEIAAPLAKLSRVNKIHGMVAGTDNKNSVPWLEMVKDGRIHGYVNTCGTNTGRCKHSRPNMAQLPKVKVDKKTHELIYGEGSGWGTDCRALFTVPSGYSLVGCDSCGQELRNLSHYLHPFDNGEYVKTILEGDIHVTNQEAAELETRDEAKTFIYSFLYGCSAIITGFAVSQHDTDRFIGTSYEDKAKAYVDKKSVTLNGVTMIKKKKGHMVAVTDQVYLSTAKGFAVQEKFRKNLNGFEKLMQWVNREAKRGYMLGLDGRLYHIRSAHKGLNTILQGAGACQLKWATNYTYDKVTKQGVIWDKDWWLCSSTHDEYQAAVIKGKEELVGGIMREGFKLAGDHYNMKCPMDGEYKIGNNYAETH
ncbi:MAG: hypothetical protein GY941_22420 [Planctomycetes bacterium]|nr:hypothetical protein [Planctomycetota bacterium]